MVTINQSLERGIAILDLLDSRSGELGVREIARALGFSPAVVQRLVNTLEKAGYLEQVSATRRYRLGYRSLLLGARLQREDRLLAKADEELSHLANEHRLNGYLGALRNGSIIYLLSVQSSGPITVRSMPGEQVNPHSTALGKAILAELPADTVARVVGPPPYAKFTPNTITDPAALAAELATIRQCGFALSREENLPGVISIGAVIRDRSEAVVAALSVAFLATERAASDMRSAIQMVLGASHRCSQSLGYAGSLNRTGDEIFDAA